MKDAPARTSGTATAADKIAQAIGLQQRGRFNDAERLFNSVLLSDPRQPDVLHFLGLLEFQTNRTESGLDKMRQSILLVPGNAGFRYNFASALLAAGRFQEALSEFKDCQALEPENADVSQGLAMALSSQAQPDEAVQVLLGALAKHPRHRGCWLTLSIIQENLWLLPEAIAAARHALQIAPADPEIQTRLAALLQAQSHPQESLKLLDAALLRSPKLAEAHYRRGDTLMSLGEFAEAKAEFEKAVALDQDISEAYIGLATIGQLRVGTPLQEKIEARITQEQDTPLEAKLNIRFALGQAWQSAHDYERAFQHFAAGNRLRRASLNYSTDEERAHFEQIAATYDQRFLERATTCGLPSTAPIFIVGMARSGTSLVEQILSRHPQVHAGGELKILPAWLRRRLGPVYSKDQICSAAALSDTDLALIGRQCLADMQALAPEARHITDKLPGNFLRLALIYVLYPNARFIHCYRDARDNCVSQFTTLFGTGHAYTSDLTELGDYYCMYLSLMQHWRDILPQGSLLDVRYEDVVENTEVQARRLLDHCRLDWDPACLDFNASTRQVHTASVFQVRQPLYHHSIGRWRHYEPYLSPLLAALKNAV